MTCHTAAQSAPTFVQEIKDVRTTETETVTFEGLFSGTPTPGTVIFITNIRSSRKTVFNEQNGFV